MDDLILEPYAVVLHWRLPAAADSWPAVLGGYLESLAQRCQAHGRCVVGHIKALALFPGGGYLRISVTAPHLPATLEGGAPPGCTELDLTLNVIVYGIPHTTLAQFALETAAQAAARQKGEVSRR